MMKYSLLFFVLWFSFSFSQSKNEKEERIPASEFPANAKSYFNTISQDVNYLKYYRESDGEKKSFEVKFKYKKEHYSVEFDTLGQLEDIEIVIKKRHIPKKTYHNISDYFNANYKKFTIVKVQKQYVNTTNKTDRQFIQHVIEKPFNEHTHFEIIAEVKTEDEHELRELTFDKNGVFEKSRKVTSSSYEHALY
ncbi:hypothetical protein SAMN05421824_0729 [Hyunsoonleella jejuensis]|uniref:Uncharacterized protein n=1 Tax=Hyunsoonleella jejuensis TaxID=419940 RepID=A0A1H9BWA7_9FLAO|nr:hypothetical protein [Hyunsoonleella jejuensis]SEP93220.1 hypothetical protein SAMN05421824_0729 [Hyunsoonleella jejuensis]